MLNCRRPIAELVIAGISAPHGLERISYVLLRDRAAFVHRHMLIGGTVLCVLGHRVVCRAVSRDQAVHVYEALSRERRPHAVHHIRVAVVGLGGIRVGHRHHHCLRRDDTGTIIIFEVISCRQGCRRHHIIGIGIRRRRRGAVIMHLKGHCLRRFILTVLGSVTP